MQIRWTMRCAATLALPALLAGGALHLRRPGTRQKASVDYVSPNIGGIGQLLTATIPYVQYPHGMARLAPDTTPGITDRYLAGKIYGFPAGPAMLMASTGDSAAAREDTRPISTTILKPRPRTTMRRICKPGESR